MGCDFLWSFGNGIAGVQRKTVADLLASVGDRLPKEIAQMQDLHFAKLVVEGRPRWTTDGYLLDNGYGERRWTRSGIRRLLDSVRSRGVWVDWTADQAETVEAILDFAQWTTISPESHTTLSTFNKKRVANKWGTSTNEDWLVRLLSAFDDMSVGRARAIIAAMGGKSPLQWTITYEELVAIPGIGAKLAGRFMAALDPTWRPPPKRTRKRAVVSALNETESAT